jgi:ABC-type transport system involved in cytochrome c biogenesis permease subunit
MGKTIIDLAGSRLVGLLRFAEQVKGKATPQSEGDLKVKPQGPTGLELPKLCFSDGLELRYWVQRAHTRPGQARRASSGDRLLGVALARQAQQPTSTATFTHSGSTLSKQVGSEAPTWARRALERALLKSNARFAGGAVTDAWAVTEAKENLEKAGPTEPADGSVGPKGLITPYLSLAERLDNYSYRVLALGFPLLTVGILSGAVWANEAWGSYWSWDPKETWALITWLVFAIYLHARILKGWTGRKPAIIATFGFFVVWFCYLGVNLLGTGLHSYGWFSN